MPKRRSGKELLDYLYSGNVVEEHIYGGTRVRIWDTSYRDASPEEIERRKARISEKAAECVATWPPEVCAQYIKEQERGKWHVQQNNHDGEACG